MVLTGGLSANRSFLVANKVDPISANRFARLRSEGKI